MLSECCRKKHITCSLEKLRVTLFFFVIQILEEKCFFNNCLILEKMVPKYTVLELKEVTSL